MKILFICSLLFSIQSLSAQQIEKLKSGYKYQDGFYTSYEIGEVLSTDVDAKSYYDTFRSRLITSRNGMLIGTSLIAIAVIKGRLGTNKPSCDGGFCPPGSFFVGAAGVIINLVGLGISANGYSQLSKAVDVYNKKQSKSKEIGNTIDLEITKSGLGIVYRF